MESEAMVESATLERTIAGFKFLITHCGDRVKVKFKPEPDYFKHWSWFEEPTYMQALEKMLEIVTYRDDWIILFNWD